MLLASFYLEDGFPERARELAREVADVDACSVVARACLQLGDLDEARRAIEQAQLINPEDGYVSALASEISLEFGDFPRAESELRDAQKWAPGDAYVLIAEARLTLRQKPLPEARAAVEQALKMVDNTPLWFSQRQVAELQQELASFEQAAKEDRDRSK